MYFIRICRDFRRSTLSVASLIYRQSYGYPDTNVPIKELYVNDRMNP